MSDSPDDGTAEDSPSANTAESSPPDGPTPDSAEDDQPGVAAEAGLDESVVGVPRELASTVRLQWIVGSTIGALVAGAVLGAIAYVVGTRTELLAAGVEPAARIGVAAFALFALFGVVRAVLLYRSWEYVVRADSLFLSRGVFTRVRTVVPYVRVQHIDTTRSPLERVLGLSTLVVYTAGSRGADVTIPGLTPDRASTLQERLERLTTESEEEDAV
ncbi:PH domain-containing protein [Halolamina sp. C58]|uniref:PH domain-containing protein n=1 Tax=Halolamina sp. C58 TaxID=3421640 RepID=UPI003EBD8DD5